MLTSTQTHAYVLSLAGSLNHAHFTKSIDVSYSCSLVLKEL